MAKSPFPGFGEGVKALWFMEKTKEEKDKGKGRKQKKNV